MLEELSRYMFGSAHIQLNKLSYLCRNVDSVVDTYSLFVQIWKIKVLIAFKKLAA